VPRLMEHVERHFLGGRRVGEDLDGEAARPAGRRAGPGGGGWGPEVPRGVQECGRGVYGGDWLLDWLGCGLVCGVGVGVVLVSGLVCGVGVVLAWWLSEGGIGRARDARRRVTSWRGRGRERAPRWAALRRRARTRGRGAASGAGANAVSGVARRARLAVSIRTGVGRGGC
jgi:hypothetical protein